MAKLKAANSLNSDLLHIGQTLVIPAKTQVAATTPAAVTPDTEATATPSTDATPAPATGPAVTEEADKMAKTAKAVAASSSTAAPTKPALDHHLYTVVKGDTLTKIAHKFKTTATALMTANNITDPTKLSIGKKLLIPSKEAHTAKVSEPAPPVVQPAQVQPKPSGTPAQLANNSGSGIGL